MRLRPVENCWWIKCDSPERWRTARKEYIFKSIRGLLTRRFKNGWRKTGAMVIWPSRALMSASQRTKWKESRNRQKISQHSLNASSKLRSFALFRHQQSGYATEQPSWLLFRPLRMALVIILCRYKTKVSLPPLPAILPFLFGCRVGRVHRVLL